MVLLIRIVQGYTALLVGGLITFVMCSGVAVLAAMSELIPHSRLGQRIRAVLPFAPQCWTRIMECVVYRGLAGVRIEVDGDIAPISGDDFVLWRVDPHFSELATPLGFKAITDVTSRFALIAKSDIFCVLRWAMKALRIGIFIDRDDRNASPMQIRDGIAVLDYGMRAIVIMPGQHRFTPERLKDQQDRYRCTFPAEVLKNLRYSLVQHYRGLYTANCALDGRRVRVIRVTTTFDLREWSWRHVPRICGRVFHVRLREDSEPLPRDPQMLCDLLNRESVETNAYIASIIEPPRVQPSGIFTGVARCACNRFRSSS